MLKIYDPRQAESMALPLLCFVDDRRGLISWGIKNHTSGCYNHVMWYHKPGFFASQNPGGFKEIPFSVYDKDKFFLKFYRIKSLTLEQKNKLREMIAKDLKRKLKYDYLGIIGQFLHLPWIQNPWKSFCSEEVILEIKAITGWNIPSKFAPAPLQKFCEGHEQWFELMGYWFND